MNSFLTSSDSSKLHFVVNMAPEYTVLKYRGIHCQKILFNPDRQAKLEEFLFPHTVKTPAHLKRIDELKKSA